jgi:hypothetical protein
MAKQRFGLLEGCGKSTTKFASMTTQFELSLKSLSWKSAICPKPPLPDASSVIKNDKLSQDVRVWMRKVFSHVVSTNREDAFLVILDFYQSTLPKSQSDKIKNPAISQNKGRKKQKPSDLAMTWKKQSGQKRKRITGSEI